MRKMVGQTLNGSITMSGISSSISSSSIITDPTVPKAMGLLQRMEQIKEVLEQCLFASARIRGVVFGEGAKDGPKPMTNNSLDSISYEALTLVCNLRGELDSITSRLDTSDDLNKAVK